MFKVFLCLIVFIGLNTILLPLLWDHLPDLIIGDSLNIPKLSPLDQANYEQKKSTSSSVKDSHAKLQSTTRGKVAISDPSDDYKPYNITIDNFNLQSNFKLFHIYPYRSIPREDFSTWIRDQFERSFENIVKNIADAELTPDLVAKNVTRGAVIASPSQEHPDYFYQWIRDGAITINSVINHLSEFDHFNNASLQTVVENYMNNSYYLQRTDNPTGNYDLDDLKSLGEPKWLVDSQPFKRVWGRPQNDGPGLRVIAIDNYLKNLDKRSLSLLNKYEHFETFEEVYHRIIKLDLRFVIKHWKDKHFDLWEEVDSYHFFTSLTQLKALKIGIKLYDRFEDTDADYLAALKAEYKKLMAFIQKDSGFVNYNLNHIVETPSILDKRSGLDAAILIGSLLTHDDKEDAIPFDVNDGLILNTLSEMIKTMKYIYPINHGRINLNLGVALGRYPEDLYDGNRIDEGNPWFLTTTAAAEIIYKLINKLYEGGEDLVIDARNQNFYFHNIIEVNNMVEFRDSSLIRSLNNFVLNLPYNSLSFNQTIGNLFNFADSFLDVVREHVADNGSMSEQFNKYTGFMQGAQELTWSYGSYWNAYRWRERALKCMLAGHIELVPAVQHSHAEVQQNNTDCDDPSNDHRVSSPSGVDLANDDVDTWDIAQCVHDRAGVQVQGLSLAQQVVSSLKHPLDQIVGNGVQVVDPLRFVLYVIHL
ncbi:hypothetical protein WICPIJ_006822 [Wickerhamomyces pijperi]|uniref:glucan 1,4-alpha-glucosidase n=1 Tax=Wickerhamomyces pijperi TaxID=599730 RepID=A0A9P8TKI4_WICPI|nr:hypothetical protein WICPIJ_006822 [Wickerhamomyces pijperi]